MSAYSYPIMSPPEICTCLRELGIDIEPEELAKPKPDKVRRQSYRALLW